MKTKLKIILLLFISFVVLSACSEENEQVNSKSSIKDGKILKGKVVNFSGVDANKLILVNDDENDDFRPEGSISSNGEFAITLSTPTPVNLENIQDFLYGDFEGDISDKAAFVSKEIFSFMEAYKGNEKVGSVFKGNSDDADWDSGEPPFSVSLFIYSDRKTIVKGYADSYHYDFTLYKGWNEIVWKVLESTSSKYSVSISDVITDDLQWKFTYEDF